MKNAFTSAKKRLVKLNIERLRKRLSDGDYKIIKCAECRMAEADLPYDVGSLHTERQAMRDSINAFEAELAVIEAETE